MYLTQASQPATSSHVRQLQRQKVKRDKTRHPEYMETGIDKWDGPLKLGYIALESEFLCLVCCRPGRELGEVALGYRFWVGAMQCGHRLGLPIEEIRPYHV